MKNKQFTSTVALMKWVDDNLHVDDVICITSTNYNLWILFYKG
jgi:hypothetical protein